MQVDLQLSHDESQDVFLQYWVLLRCSIHKEDNYQVTSIFVQLLIELKYDLLNMCDQL